jgi:hypothetical protein
MTVDRTSYPLVLLGVLLSLVTCPATRASADAVNTWAAFTRGTMVDHYDVDRSELNLAAAAYEFAWLADAAYSSDASAAEFVADRGYALVGSGGSPGTGGDYKLLRDRSRLILTVRGSSEPLDWLINAVVQTAPTGPYLGAHAGFAAAAQSLIDDIRTDVDAQLVLGASGLVVVGHSLGGAVGQLLAHRLEALGYPVERVVTFGAPAAGRSTWSSVYANMNSRTHGFQDHRDLVVCLPPDQVAWTHNGALHEVRDAEIAFGTPTDCSTVSVDVFNVVHGVATGNRCMKHLCRPGLVGAKLGG